MARSAVKQLPSPPFLPQPNSIIPTTYDLSWPAASLKSPPPTTKYQTFPNITTNFNQQPPPPLPTPTSPPKTYLTAVDVDLPERPHAESKLFKCNNPSCTKTFVQLAHLKIHERKHSGERPFTCSFANCEKSFTQLGNLKTHERSHTGEKPFVCTFADCDKRFSQMGNLRTHELLHLGVKRFGCGINGCKKSFSQLGNLKSHQVKVHSTGDDIVRSPNSDKSAKSKVTNKRPRALSLHEERKEEPEEKKQKVGSKEAKLLVKLKARVNGSDCSVDSDDSSEDEEEYDPSNILFQLHQRNQQV